MSENTRRYDDLESTKALESPHTYIFAHTPSIHLLPQPGMHILAHTSSIHLRPQLGIHIFAHTPCIHLCPQPRIHIFAHTPSRHLRPQLGIHIFARTPSIHPHTHNHSLSQYPRLNMRVDSPVKKQNTPAGSAQQHRRPVALLLPSTDSSHFVLTSWNGIALRLWHWKIKHPYADFSLGRYPWYGLHGRSMKGLFFRFRPWWGCENPQPELHWFLLATGGRSSGSAIGGGVFHLSHGATTSNHSIEPPRVTKSDPQLPSRRNHRSAGATRRRQGVERAKMLIPGHKNQNDTSPEAPELR